MLVIVLLRKWCRKRRCDHLHTSVLLPEYAYVCVCGVEMPLCVFDVCLCVYEVWCVFMCMWWGVWSVCVHVRVVGCVCVVGMCVCLRGVCVSLCVCMG